MTNQKQNRKLAAILFADIVGYTAIMQSDEHQAMSRLERYQDVLRSTVDTHRGEVIKNYGDGSLCLFSSVLDAVNCAKSIQQQLTQEPKVPLRIGLHLGDVMYRDKDIYGNAVNVSSRIESMGVAGSVMMSKNIYEKVKNQSLLSFQSFGEFEFKNIEESMEVFALANDGFAVPNKDQIQGKFKEKKTATSSSLLKYMISLAAIIVIGLGVWMWGSGSDVSMSSQVSEISEPINTPLSKSERDKRVAVMIFENQTMTSDLDAFGKMVSDWVTRGLMETGKANVISAANIQNQIAKAGLGGGANPEFAQATGVDLMLQGRYYLQENNLIIHSNLVDIKSGEVIHALAPISGSRNKSMDLLDQLTQEVLSYWAVKKASRFLQNPPKYEAYQEFVKAEETWFDDSNKENSKRHLLKSISIDPNFYAPLLKMIPLYMNRSDGQKIDSLIQHITELNPSFTEWESLRFEYLKAQVGKDHFKSGQLAEKRYRMDLSDGVANTNAASSYVKGNYPNKCLEVGLLYDVNRYGDHNGAYRNTLGWINQAYFLLGDDKAVLESSENYPYDQVHDLVAINHLYVLAKQNKYNIIPDKLNEYLSKGVYEQSMSKRPKAYMHRILCNDLYVLGEKEQLKKYAQEWITLAEKSTDDKYYLTDLANAKMYLGRWDEALDYLEQFENKNGQVKETWALALKGITYANLNQVEKAKNIITIIENSQDGQRRIYYNIAKILAALDETETAMEFLVKADAAGQRYIVRTFHFDAWFKPLFDHPEFQELVKPKG